MGLVGKSTEVTFFRIMPKVLLRPKGISTIWPGFRFRSEE